MSRSLSPSLSAIWSVDIFVGGIVLEEDIKAAGSKTEAAAAGKITKKAESLIVLPFSFAVVGQ